MSGPRRDIEEQSRHSEPSDASPADASPPTRDQRLVNAQDGSKTKPSHRDDEGLDIDIDVDVTDEVDLERTRELQRAFLHSSSDNVRMSGPPRRGGSGGARYRAMAPPPPRHRRLQTSPRAFDEPPVPGALIGAPDAAVEDVDVEDYFAGADPTLHGKELDPEELPSVAEFMGDRWEEFGSADAVSTDEDSGYQDVTATRELPALSVNAELNQTSMGEPVDDLGILGFQDPSLGGSLGSAEPISFDVGGDATLSPEGSADSAVSQAIAGLSDDVDPFGLGDDDILFGVGPISALTPASIKRPITGNDVTMPGFDVTTKPSITQRAHAPSVHTKSTDELSAPSPPAKRLGAGADKSAPNADIMSVKVRGSSQAAHGGDSRQPSSSVSRTTAKHLRLGGAGYRRNLPSANKRTSRQMSGPQPVTPLEGRGVMKTAPSRPKKSATPSGPPLPSPNVMAKAAAAMKMVTPGAERAPLPRRGSSSSDAAVKAPDYPSSPAVLPDSDRAKPSAALFDVEALSDDVSALLRHAQGLRRAKKYAEAHLVLKHLLEVDSGHFEAQQMFGLNEGALETRYLNEIGDMQALPVMAMSPGELMNIKIDSRGGYLLSMVDGHSSFQDLLELSPMEYLDTLRILAEFINKGVLMVPSLKGQLSRRLRRRKDP